MFCKDCGTPVNADAAFCPNCGAKIDKNAENFFCKDCGSSLHTNSVFCPQCGANNSNLYAPTVYPNRSKKRPLVIAAAIVVALIAIIVPICLAQNGINSSPEKVAVATIESEYEIDIKKMMKCFPDFTLKEIAVDVGLSKNADRKEIIKEVEKDYRYETPQEVEIISSEIIREYDPEDYVIFRELYHYMTDDEYDSITKIAIVEVEFTVDGDEMSSRLTCIEMDNKWYFLRDY